MTAGFFNGSLSMPNQPMFIAFINAIQNNVTGGGAAWIATFNQVNVDTTSSFNTGTFTYVIPRAGVYYLCAQVRFSGLTAAMTQYDAEILSNGLRVIHNEANPGTMRDSNTELVIRNSGLVNLAVNDAITYRVIMTGDTNTADALSGLEFSRISGFLVTAL